jgi:hypothetical protein
MSVIFICTAFINNQSFVTLGRLNFLIQTTTSTYIPLTRHEDIFTPFAFFFTSRAELVFNAAYVFLMVFIYLFHNIIFGT